MSTPVVTVLGGGISGLTAAYYLSRLAPHVRVRLLEASDRVGGWIKTERVDDNVLFEAGPRTLRPKGVGGAVLLDLLKELQLDEQILSIPVTHPSAKRRYIEYQGHINQLPSGPGDLLLHRPPIFESVISSILKEPFQRRKVGDDDETIYDFIQRRFSPHVALNLMGALAHGVYAGDCKKLSVQSTFPLLSACEQHYGSVVKGMLLGGVTLDTAKETKLAEHCQAKNPSWQKTMQGSSVIGLLPGLESLTKALYRSLVAQANVEILTNQPVTFLEKITPTSMRITTKEEQYESDHVISALPSHILSTILSPKIGLPHLAHNPSVDVAVVNLAYKKKHAQTGLDGFGFLTPHRDSGQHRVPGILGVIFDSNSMGAQDKYNDMVRFTAMIGGCDWDVAFKGQGGDHQSQALKLAQQAMSTCLGIHAQPTHHRTHLLKKCLPQYMVGHRQRLRDLHLSLQDQMGHQFSVIGNSYLGVSVPDCVKHSRLLVLDLISVGVLGDRSMKVTGLEKSMIKPGQ